MSRKLLIKSGMLDRFTKLRQNGMRGYLINILNDLLTNRKQRVVLNGQCWSCVDIRAGVPQGSILGPLSFLIYVNDLPSGFKIGCKLFANDTSFSVAHDVNTSPVISTKT